ncbi:hypothetical protein B0T16DRAFT_459510 [Cercophora newfieldiana]|uniref:AAA+ ATPase domain-containing protein n=1 Tax=Cercophora newfieldiana TaxID=92897 RepID=A0AA39XZT9_9PEZI|nr:hypothetical protein B0T16DRAFT_459510 [Cercophora newfieldiana]
MPHRRRDPDEDGDESFGPLMEHIEALSTRVVKKAMGVTSSLKRVLAPLNVEEGDVDGAFVILLTQPGFEAYHAKLEHLQKSINLWRQQGLKPRQILPRLHIAVSSDEEDVAIQFTQRYHAFLRAHRLLPIDNNISLIEGASFGASEAIERIRDGMYLISEASRLSSNDRKALATAMRHANTVVIMNYNVTNEGQNTRMSEGLFRCHFDLGQVALGDAMTAILQSMATWSKNEYRGKLRFEGGLQGQNAEAFARKVANRNRNAEAMRSGLQEELGRVVDRQTTRLLEETANGVAAADKFFISRTDLLGKEPDMRNFRELKPWQELQAMVGLEGVKASLESFLYGLLVDFHRELQGQAPLRSGLSKLFIGPPGTGKTTVAKLYGEILGAFGLLTSGELVVKNASDFIGRYIGHSEKATRTIIADARGKVLMIDEAYMLDPFYGRAGDSADPFRKGVIDTIVGEIQNTPGEDICVIMCGYKDKMERMVQAANPGLARRFPIADAFVFEEFSESQLEAVLDFKMAKEGFAMTVEAKKLALEILNNAKQQPNFGNGGEVNNLIGRALANYRTRFGAMTAEQRSGHTCFEPGDMDPLYDRVVGVEDELEREFDQYIGIDHIKTQLKALARRASALRRAGRDPVPFMPFHLVFKGAFGIGKTTMAKKMGWFYKSMRLLATDEVQEVSIRDLVADSYSGGASKVMEAMRGALGKVLFIDEAHRLAGSSNNSLDTHLQDIRESLIDATNKAEFKGKVLVVLAGSDKVGLLLKSHPQIANRFRTVMLFHQLSTDQCLALLEQRLDQEGSSVTLTDGERHQIRHIFGLLRRSAEWANGRDIDVLAKDLIGEAYEKGAFVDHAPVVTFQDILQCLQRRVPQRLQPPTTSPTRPSFSGQNLAKTEATMPISKSSHAPSIDPLVVPKQDKGKGVERLRNDTGQGSKQIDGDNQDPSEVQDVMVSPELAKKVDDSVVGEEPPVISSKGNKYTYTRLPEGRFARVIILQPAQSHSKPLHIKMQHYALGQDPKRQHRFDALSYVWGNAEKTDRVFCDGRSISVTANCASAMRHLRYKQGSRVLWIDAICIDQDSLLERNHQVTLMGEIYTAAHNVLIWLGTGSPEVDQAIQNMQRLCGLQGDWGDHEIVRIMLFRKYKGDFGNIAGMEHIMRHEWWRRMWTLQEFALARRPIIVVGNNQLVWDEFVGTATKTFFSADVGEEMVRRVRQPNTKKHHLAIKHIMPPEEAQDIRGIETSIHMAPMWKDIADAHKSRVAYQLKFQMLDRHFVASDFFLKARLRHAKDPRDKLYGLYHILQSCHYNLPALDYSRTVERIYQEVTFAILVQSRSWWILSHLFRTRSETALAGVDVASWVPDYSSQIMWHQREAFPIKDVAASHSIQWPHNHFSVELSPDGRGICCSGIFLWTVTSATSTLLPTPALDKSFDAFFEESRYEVLLSTSEDFLFTLANWLTLLTIDTQHRSTVPEDLDQDSETLHAISQTFFRAMPTRGPLFRLLPIAMAGWLETAAFQKQVYKVISVIQACMSPSPSQLCPTCGTWTAATHEGDDAMRHFMQQTCNHASWLTYIVYLLYGSAVNRAMFRTGALGTCPGHFGFCGGQPRPGDEVVLLPGAPEPVIIRRRPRTTDDDEDNDEDGAHCYRIVGVTAGLVRTPSSSRCVEEDDGHDQYGDTEGICSRFCEILDSDNAVAAHRYKPWSFYLL